MTTVAVRKFIEQTLTVLPVTIKRRPKITAVGTLYTHHNYAIIRALYLAVMRRFESNKVISRMAARAGTKTVGRSSRLKQERRAVSSSPGTNSVSLPTNIGPSPQ